MWEGSTTQTAEPSRRRRGRFRRWAQVGAGLIVVAAACAGLVRTPLFEARTVQVQGNERISDAKILRLAGIDGSTNVMLFDRTAAVHALEKDPWIAGASIVRRLPSTLDVQIRERTPMAAVQEPAGYALVAGDGVRLATVPKPKGVPLVVSSEADPQTRGATVPPTQTQVVAAARVLSVMSDSVRQVVDRVAVASDGSLELVLHGGTQVAYGAATQTKEKGRSLGAVLRWASGQGERLGSIDLNAPEAPTASSQTPSAPSTPIAPTASSPPPR